MLSPAQPSLLGSCTVILSIPVQIRFLRFGRSLLAEKGKSLTLCMHKYLYIFRCELSFHCVWNQDGCPSLPVEFFCAIGAFSCALGSQFM